MESVEAQNTNFRKIAQPSYAYAIFFHQNLLHCDILVVQYIFADQFSVIVARSFMATQCTHLQPIRKAVFMLVDNTNVNDEIYRQINRKKMIAERDMMAQKSKLQIFYYKFTFFPSAISGPKTFHYEFQTLLKCNFQITIKVSIKLIESIQ